MLVFYFLLSAVKEVETGRMNQRTAAAKRRSGKSPAGKSIFRFGDRVFTVAAGFAVLKLVRKNILQPDFQFNENRFQLVQRQVVFAMLQAKQRLVGHARLLGKLRIGKIAPLFTQEFRQLSVQIASHGPKVAETA